MAEQQGMLAGHKWRGTIADEFARACIHRVDHGAGEPLTLDQATDQVRDLVKQVRREDMPTLVAYLACQVIGARRSQSADANLAMVQISSIVDEWRKRHAD